MENKIRSTCFLIGASIFLLASGLLNKRLHPPKINIEKQEDAINLNDQFLRFVFAGYKRLIADILWISTLLESDTAHYKQKDLNNWMFLRFNTITNLDPLFLDAYIFGGTYLDIVKDDLKGASIIFDKGLEQYPENYHLNFNAAFMYAMELGEIDKGLKLYKSIKDHPQAPPFLKSLITKLEHERSGDLEATFQTLKSIYENESEDPILRSKLESDLYSIKAAIDLKCLNEGQDIKSCDKLDYRNQPYIFSEGKYKAQYEYNPYKLHTRK